MRGSFELVSGASREKPLKTLAPKQEVDQKAPTLFRCVVWVCVLLAGLDQTAPLNLHKRFKQRHAFRFGV